MKSIYEMNEEERASLSPGDFTEAYIRDNASLVDEWTGTPYLEHGPAIPGRNQVERDLNKARYARILQNYIDFYFPPTKKRDGVEHKTVSEAMKVVKTMIPENGLLPEGFSYQASLEETVSAASTTSWSGATMLPMVLGYARKILPKLYGMQFYQTQPLERPSGRVFFIVRNRDSNGTTDGQIAQRGGWSYRSWITDPGEVTNITTGVTFTITSSDVNAKSRKILAQTSIEVEQDLRAYFGWDAVGMVSDIATTEMALEIDEELVYGLYNHAVTNGVGQFQYGTLSVPTGETSESYQKKIIEILNRAGHAIWHEKRVLPNYGILGTEWTNLLTNLALFRTNTEEVNFTSFLMPTVQLPVVGNPMAYTAAKPWPVAEGILGHKGVDYVDGGAFFLPYLPIQLAGTWFNPQNDQRQLSWISRYATYFHKFTGQKESFAWLTTGTSLSGLSYPASVEYT